MVREGKALLLYPEILRAAERASLLIHKENVCANICLGKCIAERWGLMSMWILDPLLKCAFVTPPHIRCESTQQLVLRSLDPLRLLSKLTSI